MVADVKKFVAPFSTNNPKRGSGRWLVVSQLSGQPMRPFGKFASKEAAEEAKNLVHLAFLTLLQVAVVVFEAIKNISEEDEDFDGDFDDDKDPSYWPEQTKGDALVAANEVIKAFGIKGKALQMLQDVYAWHFDNGCTCDSDFYTEDQEDRFKSIVRAKDMRESEMNYFSIDVVDLVEEFGEKRKERKRARDDDDEAAAEDDESQSKRIRVSVPKSKKSSSSAATASSSKKSSKIVDIVDSDDEEPKPKTKPKPKGAGRARGGGARRRDEDEEDEEDEEEEDEE